uniref:G_PROTEIN_RECEP_F1_2 domain-containing protein n=1 Tax=Panagrellus redivivus TaxID=6233 RepID=A0A7E4VTP6_PANRE
MSVTTPRPNVTTPRSALTNVDEFDYSGFEDVTTPGYSVANVSDFSAIVAVFIIGIVTSVGVLVTVVVKNGRNFRGVRWYAVNLSICNFIYLAAVIAQNEQLPFIRMANFTAKSMIVALKPAVVQWYMTVYCSTTSVLFIETIMRARTSSKGFQHYFWLPFIIIVDVVPGIYAYLRALPWKDMQLEPDPLSIYHVIWLALLIVTFLIMLFIFFVVICCGMRGTSHADRSRFGKSAFVAIFVYGFVTFWWQLSGAYFIGSKLMKNASMDPQMLDTLAKYQDLVSMVTNMREWAERSQPAIVGLMALIALPTINMANIGASRPSSGSRISDSNEPVMTAAATKTDSL